MSSGFKVVELLLRILVSSLLKWTYLGSKCSVTASPRASATRVCFTPTSPPGRYPTVCERPRRRGVKCQGDTGGQMKSWCRYLEDFKWQRKCCFMLAAQMDVPVFPCCTLIKSQILICHLNLPSAEWRVFWITYCTCG